MQMQTATPTASMDSARYARAIAASKRVRWDLDRDVLRGRTLDLTRKYMPDSLSRVKELPFLTPAEARLMSQVQGRTYANLFRMVERFIGAKTLELGREHGMGDQVAMEALVRLTDEELKHQEMFRRIDEMIGAVMPFGYEFLPDANEVAKMVLSKNTWAVLALTLDLEIYSQAHYRASIEPDPELSELWKDVFLFHWKEESQHAILDELEWRREDDTADAATRDRGVTELIELVAAIDQTLMAQARADADYFISIAGRSFPAAEKASIHDVMFKAYRWQHIILGATEPRYVEVLKALVTPAQMERIGQALAPIATHVAA